MEETSSGYAIAYFLISNDLDLNLFILLIISNKRISDRVKKIPTIAIKDYQVSISIWDIKRFFDIESSKNKKETLLIDFLEEFNTTISSLPVISPPLHINHILAVISGDILAKLL